MSDDRVTKSVADAIAAQQAPPKLPKRFYKTVSVESRDGGYVVALDGRAVRTPGGRELVLPNEMLAQRIANEWQAQERQIDLAAMPLTKLANAACEGVATRKDEVRADIVKYAGSDLLCYRAEHPRELIERQNELWDPVLAWAKAEHGIDLALAKGVMPLRQPEAALATLDEKIAADYADPFALAALHVLTTICGSALLAFAHGEGRMTADEIWSAAHVDEDWQIEKWGMDDEASRARAARKDDFMAAVTMLELLR